MTRETPSEVVILGVHKPFIESYGKKFTPVDPSDPFPGCNDQQYVKGLIKVGVVGKANGYWVTRNDEILTGIDRKGNPEYYGPG